MDASPTGERHVAAGAARADQARLSLGNEATPTPQPTRRYFGHAQSPPPLQAHIDLGLAMRFDDHDVDGAIPAGYTYLGQFIFHDISYLKTDPTKPLDPENLRSAALDLDSVFGPVDYSGLVTRGPPPPAMPLGTTYPEGHLLDLPRTAEGCPLTADPRSDDLLPLAQIHMAVVRFRNAILETVGDAREAYRLCVEHFQSIVLHDYLPRVVDPEVYDDVCRNGRTVIWTEEEKRAGQRFLLPLEFGAAVGRFGHSMVRSGYRPWSLHQHGARVNQFWRHTFNSGDMHFVRLRSDWEIRWQRLFPIQAKTDPRDRPEQPILAGRIGTRLAAPLADISRHAWRAGRESGAHLSGNLAVRSLVLSHKLSIASGQQVAGQLKLALGRTGRLPPPVLRLEELTENETPALRQVLERSAHAGSTLAEHTPLWYYVLKEAEAFAQGKNLGPLGSRIVMETVHAAIEAAPQSILGCATRWRPTLAAGDGAIFTFQDLLGFSKCV